MRKLPSAVVPLASGVLAFALVVSCGERPVRSVGGLRAQDSEAELPAPAVLSPVDASVAVVAPDLAAEARLMLPIAARAHAPEAPPAGWCGETAIQEGLLHLGVWAPQRVINKAGRPTHPDLYSPDIPVALSELGVRYTFYSGARGFDGFARWVRAALEEGDPVIAGVKILPTAHPEWGLDHFVLVVGHGDKGLLVNTTWGHRLWVADTTTPGLSFKNAFYAIRLGGVAVAAGGRAARLRVLEESETKVKVRVTCSGVVSGSTYRVERRRARTDEKVVGSEDITATSDHVEREVSFDAEQPARFQCVKVD